MNTVSISSNTCISTVQNSVDAINNLEKQIKRGLDILEKMTNIGYIVGGGMAFTLGVVSTGAFTVAIWRLLQSKFPSLQTKVGIVTEQSTVSATNP